MIDRIRSILAIDWEAHPLSGVVAVSYRLVAAMILKTDPAVPLRSAARVRRSSQPLSVALVFRITADLVVIVEGDLVAF